MRSYRADSQPVHVNHLAEKKAPETANPARKRGQMSGKPENIVRVVATTFPEIRPLVNCENTRFRNGRFCADFRPLLGGLRCATRREIHVCDYRFAESPAPEAGKGLN
jgi:hypothetical protein